MAGYSMSFEVVKTALEHCQNMRGLAAITGFYLFCVQDAYK